jgi:hypothetical protein
LKPLLSVFLPILGFLLPSLFHTKIVLLSLISLNVSSVTDPDAEQAIRHLSPSKCIGPHFNYFLDDLLSVRTDSVKDLGLTSDSKLHFRRHVDYLHSEAQTLLGVIRFFTYNLSSLDSIKVSCITLIHSKLKYASVI